MTLPRPFWLLWLGQTLYRVGLLAPAFLVLYLQEDGLADDRTIAVIVGLFGAGVLVGGLLGGVVADLVGARRTILWSQPVALVTAMLFLISTDIRVIGVLSLLAGVLSSVDRPAAAGLIATLVPHEQFAKAYSILLIGFNVGMSLGPVLAGVLLTVAPAGLFVLWAASSLAYASLVWWLPVDERAAAAEQEGSTLLRRTVLGLVEPFRSRVLLVFLGLTALLAAIYLQLNSTLPLHMRSEGLTAAEIGLIIAVNAVLSVLLLPLVPRLVRGMRDEVPLALAALLVAIGFGMNAFASGIPTFVAAVVVWTAGEVLWAPMSATFLAKRAPAGRTSSYQGAFFFAWNAAFVVGGPVGITVANAWGYELLWFCTFVVGAVAALGLLLMARIPGFAPVAAESKVER
ncbi:MAG TPA: MFS transporter [Jatrophihabitans sp.]|jgi:MFS family permease|uniref:MFS transporter n=1 Tax=Jatrophihabitans sp. TaxID=1932789 RepID=UPI002EE0DB0E